MLKCKVLLGEKVAPVQGESSPGTGRKAKKLWTSGAAGEQIRTFIGYDENMEADFIASEIRRLVTQGFKYSDIAILYRTNAQTRALDESLVRERVPYRIFGGLNFFDRKEIKDILGYLRILVNPSDNQAFQRIVNTPPRGIGAQALQSIAEESRNAGVPFLHASVSVAESNKSVYRFLGLMAELKQASETMKLGQLIEFIVERSEYGPKLAAMLEEERRLCYVGITRAMKMLYMTRAYYRGMFGSGGQSGGAGGARIVSRFAKDIDRNRMLAVGTERSQGATFLEGYPRFSFEDEGVDDGGGGYDGGWRKKPKTSRVLDRPQPQAPLSLDRIKNLLAPADSITTQKGPEVPKEYFNKPAAALEQLAEGVEVLHPSFGRGVVEAVNGQGTSASIVVKFESFEEPKKLVYRFAKLVLGDAAS